MTLSACVIVTSPYDVIVNAVQWWENSITSMRDSDHANTVAFYCTIRRRFALFVYQSWPLLVVNVYASDWCPSVRPSVCPVDRQQPLTGYWSLAHPLCAKRRQGGLLSFFCFNIFSNFCQTNYLNIYRTYLHEICMIGRTLAVDEWSEGTLP